MTTDVGVSLGISPDQASVGLLSYERGQGSLGQFALFVEGVETQPASLGSLRQRGVAVSGHDVPGLQELPCNNNTSQRSEVLVILPDQTCWSLAKLSTMPARLCWVFLEQFRAGEWNIGLLLFLSGHSLNGVSSPGHPIAL